MAPEDGARLALQRRAMSTDGAQAATGRGPRGPLQTQMETPTGWGEKARGDKSQEASTSPTSFPDFKLEPQKSLSAPSSPRSVARRDSTAQRHSPPCPSFTGRFSSASTPKLQAFARNSTHWVDPNELHIDLSTVARHRHRRGRCYPHAATTAGTTTTQQPDVAVPAPHETKRSHRSQRTERLKALFTEMSK